MADKLRRSDFLVVAESLFPDLWLMFSTFTGAFETVTTQRLEMLSKILENPRSESHPEITWLKSRGFLVDFDERERLRSRYLSIREAARAEETGGLSLTIAPTVRCNFACTYCFEKHPERDLSDTDNAGLLRFVDGRLRQGTYLAVTWFGGEPLLRFKELERTYGALSALARSKDCSFSHSIITNGALLKGERLDFLESTNIESVQVTLDGPARIHDRRRWTSGKGRTFDLIMNNLQNAVRRVPVQLRVNVDKRNCGLLSELLDELEARDMKGWIQPYLGHVEAYTGEVEDLESSALGREEFAQVELEFRAALWQRGFSGAPSLPVPREGTICSADSPNAYVVSPGGALFDCWNETALDPDAARHQIDSQGRLVNNPGSVQRDWTRYDPFAHQECQKCAVQPLCKGGCPWEAAKKPLHLTGNCTPYRWTLHDFLRLYHLGQSLYTNAEV